MKDYTTASSFKCCGNEAWIHDGKELPPCPTCGKVWVGREYRHDGITYFDAVEKEAIKCDSSSD